MYVQVEQSVTFAVDITDFRRKVKEQDLSVTLAVVYAVCKCANEIEAFRHRFLDGREVLFEHIDTAFTYLNQETGLFKVVNVSVQAHHSFVDGIHIGQFADKLQRYMEAA